MRIRWFPQGHDRSFHYLAAVLVAPLLALAACSSVDAASSQVCSAQADVQSSYEDLTQSIQARQFSSATDDLKALQQSIQELKDAEDNLDEATRKQVESEIDDLNRSLQSMTEAKSADDLQQALSDSGQQLQSTLAAIKTSTAC